MGKEAKKGVNKLKIGLVVSAIVIVVLAGLNIWFYMNKTSLELQLKERWDSYGSELWWHSYYQNLSDQILSEKNALQTAYDDYMATHSHTNSEYDTLQSTYNNYVATHSHTDTEYNELIAIANLQKSQLIVDDETIPQGAGARTLVETFTATYSGYVTVSITSSTTNAYIDVEFYFKDQFFKFTKTLGTSGSARFCVLPTTVYIYVGNSNWFDPATHIVSATYWY